MTRPVINELNASPLRPLVHEPYRMSSLTFERPSTSRMRSSGRSRSRRSKTRSRSPRSNSQRQMAQLPRLLNHSPGFNSVTPESVRKFQRAESLELGPRGPTPEKIIQEEFEHANPLYRHRSVRQSTKSPSVVEYGSLMTSLADRRLNRSLRAFAHHRGAEKPFIKIDGKLLYRNLTSDRKHKGSLYYVDDEGKRIYRDSWPASLKRDYDTYLQQRRR